MEENDHVGIRRAARRRLQIELGISESDIELSDFKILTRIIYGAPSDSTWGEHEIDYILFIRKDLEMNPNPNEVEEVVYVSRSNFNDFKKNLEEKSVQLTPWFKLISDTHLSKWWNQLELGNIQDFDTAIHNLNS